MRRVPNTVVTLAAGTVLYHGAKKRPPKHVPVFLTPNLDFARRYGQVFAYRVVQDVPRLYFSQSPDDLVESLGGDPETQVPAELVDTLLEDYQSGAPEALHGFWLDRGHGDVEILLLDQDFVAPVDSSRPVLSNPLHYFRRRRNPVIRAYHGSPTLLNRLDLSAASLSATFGAAVYLSESPEDALSWARHKAGTPHVYLYEVLLHVAPDSVLSADEGLSRTQAQRIAQVIGRPVETVPVITFEKRFGTVSEGLLRSGITVWEHRLRAGAPKHYAVYDPSVIEIVSTTRI